MIKHLKVTSVNIFREYNPNTRELIYFCQLSSMPYTQRLQLDSLNIELRDKSFESFSEAQWYAKELMARYTEDRTPMYSDGDLLSHIYTIYPEDIEV